MLNSQTRPYNYLVYICVTAVILLLIFSYFYWTLPTELTLRMTSYVQIFTVFTLMVTGIITIMTFKHQLDDRNRNFMMQYANVAQSEINDIEKQFMANPLLDRLYFEMYSHLPNVHKIQEMKLARHETLRESPEVLKSELHMASIIFQKIADIYFCEGLNTNEKTNVMEWINMFHVWMKSPILLEHWKYLKSEHHPNVQKFVDEILIRQNPYLIKESSRIA